MNYSTDEVAAFILAYGRAAVRTNTEGAVGDAVCQMFPGLGNEQFLDALFLAENVARLERVKENVHLRFRAPRTGIASGRT
jgi:hypothetical protein